MRTKCLQGRAGQLTIGKQYQPLAYDHEVKMVQVVNDQGNEQWFFADRFEPFDAKGLPRFQPVVLKTTKKAK